MPEILFGKYKTVQFLLIYCLGEKPHPFHCTKERDYQGKDIKNASFENFARATDAIIWSVCDRATAVILNFFLDRALALD